jgi:hypothetical protein
LIDDNSLLVIDERNFQYMLDHATDIVHQPTDAFPATLNGDAMYYGTEIRGYPAEIDVRRRIVKWRFFRNDPVVKNLSDIDQARLPSRDLALHAFAFGELYGLLVDLGFQDIRTFADLHEVTPAGGGLPGRSSISDAGFITYVARRGPARAPQPDDVRLRHGPGLPGA